MPKSGSSSWYVQEMKLAVLEGAEVIVSDDVFDAEVEVLEMIVAEDDVLDAEAELLDDVFGSVGAAVNVGFITVGTLAGQAHVVCKVVVVPVTSQPVAVDEQLVVGQVVVSDESPDETVDTSQLMLQFDTVRVVSHVDVLLDWSLDVLVDWSLDVLVGWSF